MKKICIVALISALTGCAAVEWVGPDGSRAPEIAKKQCDYEAEQHYGGWGRTGYDLLAAADRKATLIQMCMESRGYSRASASQQPSRQEGSKTVASMAANDNNPVKNKKDEVCGSIQKWSEAVAAMKVVGRTQGQVLTFLESQKPRLKDWEFVLMSYATGVVYEERSGIDAVRKINDKCDRNIETLAAMTARGEKITSLPY